MRDPAAQVEAPPPTLKAQLAQSEAPSAAYVLAAQSAHVPAAVVDAPVSLVVPPTCVPHVVTGVQEAWLAELV